MSDIAALVANNLDIWTSATQRKSSAGRGGGKRISLYGLERLRALILELAVRGKLVQQDVGDEPATALLPKMAAERQRRIKANEIKAAKGPAEPSSRPFDLPPGWVWLPLWQTGNIFTGNSINSSLRVELETNSEGRPFVATKDVGYGLDAINYDNGLTVTFSDQRFNVARPDSVFICAEGGSAGRKIAISDREIAFGNKLIANEPWPQIEPRFILYTYLSDFFFNCFSKEMTGIIGGISRAKFLALPFPLPPTAEQQRIVAKVDTLMALCDALERESADAMAAHQTLVEELLATLVNSASAADLAVNWARLEIHFGTLFTTDASIDALKQTILDLAVDGALTEPIETIGASKAAVAAAMQSKIILGKNEGLRARPPIVRGKLARADETFPPHWIITDFDTVFVTVSGVTKGQKIATNEAVEAPYLRVANVQRGYLDLDEMKNITVKQSDFERYQLREGDVLMTEGGDWDKLGRAAIWRGEVSHCIHQNHVFRVRFDQDAILPEWVVLFVNSPLGREFFSRAAKQTTNLASINMTQLRSCPIPIPPLTEQHRIVAKVDELMALCDALKARLADVAQTQRHLADAVIERAAV